LHVILELRSEEEGGMLETDLARQLEGLFHEVGEGSSTPASPRASSSTCSSWSPTSSRSRPLAPTGPDTMPGSLSLDTHKPTHSKVKFRVPFSAKMGEIEGGAERLELARA
jgi:hypothetical protein